MFVGRKASRFQDIGVSGVHRLLDNVEELKKFKDIREPELDDKIKANLEEYKKQLENE